MTASVGSSTSTLYDFDKNGVIDVNDFNKIFDAHLTPAQYQSYLKAGVPEQDINEVAASGMSAEQYSACKNAGMSTEEIKGYMQAGVPPQDILSVRSYGMSSDQYAACKNAGMSNEEIKGYMQAGVPPQDILSIRSSGMSAEQYAACKSAGMSNEEIKGYVQAGVPPQDILSIKSLGITPQEYKDCINSGMSSEDIKNISVSDLNQMRELGLSPSDYKNYKACQNLGMSNEQIKTYLNAGVSMEQMPAAYQLEKDLVAQGIPTEEASMYVRTQIANGKSPEDIRGFLSSMSSEDTKLYLNDYLMLMKSGKNISEAEAFIDKNGVGKSADYTEKAADIKNGYSNALDLNTQNNTNDNNDDSENTEKS